MLDRIHHAGLAIGDLTAGKRLFGDALGLRVDETRSPLPGGRQQRGGDSTDILDIPIADAEIELNMPVGTQGGTGRFVQSRGGVGALHHICLHSTNVPDDVERMRKAGLQQLASPEQIAAGPWKTVAFFHPRTCMGILLEIWPTEPVRKDDGSEKVFTRLHHIGVVSKDLETARHFWVDLLGYKVDTSRSPLPNGRQWDSDNVKILDVPIGNSAIECACPQDATSGTAKFLAKYGGTLGGTMHHIALGTKDVKAAAERLQSRGMRLIGRPTNDLAWVHPKSAIGVLIEITRDA